MLQAGFVQLGGEDNRIDMNNNEILQFNRPVVIGGIGEDGVTPAGIGGTIISLSLITFQILHRSDILMHLKISRLLLLDTSIFLYINMCL